MRQRRTKPDAVEALYWQLTHLAKHVPWPTLEYRFSTRKDYRLDMAWPAPLLKIGLEVDGGIWRRGGGAHTGTGHIRDIRKNNEAILCGYRVLHFIPEDIVSSSGRPTMVALDVIVELFESLGYKKP